MGSGQESKGAGSTAQDPITARREVLLEAPEGVEAGALWGLLQGSGYKVSWCPGPEGPPASWCPLLSGHRCTLVESSDVVVSALGFHDPACRQVLAELGRLHPEAAVIVETSRSEAFQWEPLLQGHLVLPMPHSARALLEDVEAALSRAANEGGI